MIAHVELRVFKETPVLSVGTILRKRPRITPCVIKPAATYAATVVFLTQSEMVIYGSAHRKISI
jgi:hypothetical protein